MSGASILRDPLGMGNEFNLRVRFKLQSYATAILTAYNSGNSLNIQDLRIFLRLKSIFSSMSWKS